MNSFTMKTEPTNFSIEDFANRLGDTAAWAIYPVQKRDFVQRLLSVRLFELQITQEVNSKFNGEVSFFAVYHDTEHVDNLKTLPLLPITPITSLKSKAHHYQNYYELVIDNYLSPEEKNEVLEDRDKISGFSMNWFNDKAVLKLGFNYYFNGCLAFQTVKST